MPRVDLTRDADANVEIGLLLAILDDVTKEWTEELGDVSEEQIIWQPFPHGHSIGGVILHIADVEAHWIHEVAGGMERSTEELQTLLSDETDQYAQLWPTPPARPLAWYLQQHRAVRERTRQTVLALNNPDHVGTRKQTEFTLRWLLNHVISHEAYHGGQAVLLAIVQQSSPSTTQEKES